MDVACQYEIAKRPVMVAKTVPDNIVSRLPSSRVRPTMTVGQIKTLARELYPEAKHTVTVWSDSHIIIDDNKTLLDLFAARMIRVLVMDAAECIRLFFRDVRNQTHEIWVPTTYTVSQLKRMLVALSDLHDANESVRHTYTGGRDLLAAGLVKDGTIHQHLSLQGGGPDQTVSFSAMEQKKVIYFTDNAPQWRGARPGLCLETVCKNRSCKAFDQFVIVSRDMQETNVLDANLKLTCPACNEAVSMRNGYGTCAFNRCSWKMVGMLANGIVRQTEWETVTGDEYVRFKGSPADGGFQKLWARLTVFVEKASLHPPSCLHCFEPVTDKAQCPPCGCTIHTACIASTGYGDCPACMNVVPSDILMAAKALGKKERTSPGATIDTAATSASIIVIN